MQVEMVVKDLFLSSFVLLLNLGFLLPFALIPSVLHHPHIGLPL